MEIPDHGIQVKYIAIYLYWFTQQHVYGFRTRQCLYMQVRITGENCVSCKLYHACHLLRQLFHADLLKFTNRITYAENFLIEWENTTEFNELHAAESETTS